MRFLKETVLYFIFGEKFIEPATYEQVLKDFFLIIEYVRTSPLSDKSVNLMLSEKSKTFVQSFLCVD